MSEYPEHDKLMAIKGQSQMIGEFLDTMKSRGYAFCTWVTPPDDNPRWVHEETGLPTSVFNRWSMENPNYVEEGWVPAGKSIEQILAEFFDIDQTKLEDEKRQMLEEIRAQEGSR